ncbi:MAG: CHAD domain-containing protein, partial [Planctomycetaceae bacterium]
ARWENTRPLHQLRVALRRVLAATRAWQGLLEPDAAESLNVALRRLRRRCGPARDLDVRRIALERLLSNCDPRHLAVVDLLYEQATLAREELQPGLLRQLERFTRRIPDPIPRLNATPPVEPALGAQPAAVAALRAQVGQALEQLPISTGELPADLHALRLALKRLRYGLELLAECVPQQSLADSLKRLRQLQGSLGDFHDAEVAREELRALRQRWDRQRHRRHWTDHPAGLFTWKELRSGLKYLRRQYRRQRDSALAEFQASWSAAVSPEGLPLLRHALAVEPLCAPHVPAEVEARAAPPVSVATTR